MHNATYMLVVVLAQIEKVRELLPSDDIPPYRDRREKDAWPVDEYDCFRDPLISRLLRCEGQGTHLACSAIQLRVRARSQRARGLGAFPGNDRSGWTVRPCMALV